jgi:hypothetical protein
MAYSGWQPWMVVLSAASSAMANWAVSGCFVCSHLLAVGWPIHAVRWSIHGVPMLEDPVPPPRGFPPARGARVDVSGSARPITPGRARAALYSSARHPRTRGNGFWKIQIQLDFFQLDFVGLDYFGCRCPHAKLNWMSKHELLILMFGYGRVFRI